MPAAVAVPAEAKGTAPEGLSYGRDPNRPPARTAVLDVWMGGSLCKVSRARAPRGPVDALPKLEADGVEDAPPPPPSWQVGEFSKGSRRALMHQLAKVRQDTPGLLVTLTWPTWAAPDSAAWHGAWDRFRVAMARRFPEVGGVWRREFTKRGVVHLHLLAYGVPYPGMRSWLPAAWAHAVRAPNEELRRRVGSSVEEVRRGEAVQRYVAKYVAKDTGTLDGDGERVPMGRWWGVFGRAHLPLAPVLTVAIDDAAAVALMRAASKFLEAQSLHRQRQRHEKRGGKTPRRYRLPRPRSGRAILTSTPERWAALALAHDGMHAPALVLAPREGHHRLTTDSPVEGSAPAP